jgi:uncharacterized protein YjdB
MKKLLLMKTMLLLCALIVGSSSVWADEVTFDFATLASANSWKNGVAYTSVTIDPITLNAVGGGNNGKYYTSDDSWRMYNNGTVSIVPADGYLITAVSSTPSQTFTISEGKASLACTATIKFTSITVTYSAGSLAPVDVTGVSLDKSELKLAVGEKSTLTPTISPSNASNKNLSWESNHTDIATVDEGVVTAVAVGTATITVTTEDGAKTATCDVTVTPAPAVSATFDFTTNDVWGFPEDEKKVPENTYSNGTYSIKLQGSTGNGYYFDTKNNNLLLGKSEATLTFPTFTFNVKKIKVYGAEGASASVTFNIFVGSDEVSTGVTSSKVTQEFAIDEASQAAGTKYVLKVTNANNMRISKIEIYGYETTPAVTADGWATYVTTNPCRFAEGDAFVVTAASDKVYLHSVTDVPNNTPVLLKGAGVKTAEVLPTTSAISNELAISNGSSIDGYVLAKKSGVVGFYKWAGGSLTSGKVYLPSSAVSGAREFIGFDDATAIEAVKTQNVENDQFFNLAGQRVAQPTKGLYIVNGKKVVIK